MEREAKNRPEASPFTQVALAQLGRLRISNKDSNTIGNEYAQRFESCLALLRKEGQILSWKQTRQNSDDDKQGVDYFVEDGKGSQIPFQVTSRPENGNPKTRKRKREKLKLNDIPTVYILNKDKRERSKMKLKDEIFQKIKDYRVRHPND